MEAAGTVPPAADPHRRPGNQNARKDKNAGDNSEKHNPRFQRGTSRDYRVARLKRDHPEVAERLAAGEFKSVAAADPLPEGLGTTLEILPTFCRDDARLLALLDEALQRGPGNAEGTNQHTERDEGGTVSNTHGSELRPTTGSRARALRKLRTEAEQSAQVQAIYDRVLKGEISPHRGMVEAGFRKLPTPLDILKRVWAKASEAERAQFLAWAQGGGVDGLVG